MLLLLPISAFAGSTTTIVNAGSNDGAFRTVLTMIGDKINHTFVQANNPIIADKHFNKKMFLLCGVQNGQEMKLYQQLK